MKNKALLVIVISAMCGGATPPFAKYGLESIGLFTSITLRFLLASLILLPFVLLMRRNLSRFSWKHAQIGAIGALNPILFLIGLQFTTSATSTLMYAAIPGLTTLYVRLIKKDHVTGQQGAGVVAGFAGVAIIVLVPMLGHNDNDPQGLIGNLIIICAVLSFFLFGLISRAEQQKTEVSPIALTFYFSVITLVLSLPFTMVEILRDQQAITRIELPHFLAVVETGIIGTGILYLTYQYALKLSGELTASLFTYLQPVATFVFAVLLVDERITPALVVGGLIAVLGAQMAAGRLSWPKRRRTRKLGNLNQPLEPDMLD